MILKEALRKDRLVEIAKTKTRFLSILSLIALGVFVYTGLKATGANMRATIDEYYRNYDMPDITVQSTLGLDDDDENIIKNFGGIDTLEFAYMADYILDEDRDVIRLESKPEALTRYEILEGRDIEDPGEILLDEKLKHNGYEIGQEMELLKDEVQMDILKRRNFKIVGFVRTPEYLNYSTRGKTNIGSGDLLGYGIIDADDFKSPVYSIAKIRFKDTKDLETYSDEYEDKIDSHMKKLREKFKDRPQNRFNKVVGDAKAEIEAAEKKLESAKKELKRGKDKLDQAEKDIEYGKKRLASERANAVVEMIEGREKLLTGEAEMNAAENKVDAGTILRNSGNRSLSRMQSDLQGSYEGLNRAKARLDELNSKIYELESKGDLNEIERQQLDAYKYRYNLAASDYNRIVTDIDSLYTQINENQQELRNADSELKSGSEQIEKGKAQLEQGEIALSKAQLYADSEFEKAEEQIQDGEQKYEDGLKEYNAKKDEAEDKIKKGEESLKEAKEEVNRIKRPVYLIYSRLDSLDYYQFIDNSKRLDMLSNVFPVFFFAIAILVSLTTMTRMVDEQRNFMGTLKALGYSNRDISKKFTHYGLYSSAIGIAIGAALGTTFLSKMIFDAYAAPYNMGDQYLTLPHYKNIVVSALISLLSTAGSAYWVAKKDLGEKATELMRPKAPKSGSRIFLERIKPLWKRLSFIQKVTARNLFRYKKRMLMTVFGVAGCTALIFMGIGIKNSLSGLSEKQYEDLFGFDAIISYNIEDFPKSDYKNALKGVKNIKSSMKILNMTGKIDFPEFKHEDTMLLATDNIKQFNKYIKLRNRKTGERYELNDDGAFICEKVADIQGLKIGDRFKFIDQEQNSYNIRVSGITENYAGQYIYMTDKYYEKVFGQKYEDNAYLVKTDNNSDAHMEQLGKDIMQNKAAIAIISTNYIKNIINDMLKSIDMIVIVILACASMLAVVVLYNLTNINVSERERELSTIKVLGFFDNEVTAYVYRETIILTIMGIALGLFMGIYLHKYVLLSVEPPSVMMDPTTKWYNYVISSGVTILISIGVLFIIHNKLKNINMIESLKSVE